MNQHDSTQTDTARGLTLAIASVFCFAMTSILLSHLNSAYGVDSWVASAYRSIVGLVFIFAMQRKTGKLQFAHIFSNCLLFVRGLVGGATIPLYYICIMELGPGRASMIGGTYPLFAAVFAVFFLREGLKRNYFIYSALALIALVMMFAEKDSGDGKLFYNILAIIGAALGGLCVVMIRHLRLSETTSTIFASQCVFTFIITVLVAGNRLIISDLQALAFALLAAITVVGGQLTLTESFRHINVVKGSTLQMLTPALTVFLSGLIIGEHFSILELTGGAVIFFASCQIVRSR